LICISQADLHPSARHNAGESNYASLLSGVGASLSNQTTFGEIHTAPGHHLYSRSLDSTVTNSLFYRLGWDGSQSINIGDLIRSTGADFYFTNNNVFDFLGEMSDGSGAPEISILNYAISLPDNSPLHILLLHFTKLKGNFSGTLTCYGYYSYH